ncbi:MAG: DUF4412 domain-containing protein [Halofilum sp. (in: g-proteobacteria)]|nr:DUF4412 domain-containing protein [Halofilum sp. (in: g-proteobacteria)]
MRKATITICLLAGLLVATPALAGTVIEVNVTGEGTTRMLISGDRMRMESSDNVTLFDAAANEVTVLNLQEQTYHVMTKQDVQRMAKQMQQVRKQVEQQLQNMPEDQRAQMRKQMEQMMPGGGPPPKIRVEPTGGSGIVAGASCRKARLFRDDQATHELCVAEPGALGIPSDAFDTMMAMFGFFEEISGAAGGEGADIQVRAMEEMMSELGGMPARSRPLAGGAAWEIAGVESRSIDAGQFEVPSGYTEADPMSGQMQ